MKILTHFVYPPIPDRRWDWSAVTDSYEPGCPIGQGQTENLAVRDLLDQLEDARIWQRKDYDVNCDSSCWVPIEREPAITIEQLEAKIRRMRSDTNAADAIAAIHDSRKRRPIEWPSQ